MKHLPILAACLGLAACSSDADVASRNISKAADMFEINRRIIVINAITGDYLLSVEGLCSLGNSDTASRMSITCKAGPNLYKKHIIGLSDNVTFVSEQLEPAAANVYHYRVIFKPSVIIPTIDPRL